MKPFALAVDIAWSWFYDAQLKITLLTLPILAYSCFKREISKRFPLWSNQAKKTNNCKKLARATEKSNKLLTIAVVNGMLSMNDDTNAETHTMTTTAMPSLPYEEEKQKHNECINKPPTA